MIPTNNKVIVRVNMKQKDSFTINGVTISTALKYEVNYREKSPVVACVVKGNQVVKEGEILLCHHNLFYPPSPHFLQDDLFAVPFRPILFAKINTQGEISPICGNVICERVLIESTIPLPPEQQKTYINRAIVKDAGSLPFKPGQLIFHRPNAGYDIVYVWDSIEYRITKVHMDQICGVVK